MKKYTSKKGGPQDALAPRGRTCIDGTPSGPSGLKKYIVFLIVTPAHLWNNDIIMDIAHGIISSRDPLMASPT
jgi:hypothetical protein